MSSKDSVYPGSRPYKSSSTATTRSMHSDHTRQRAEYSRHEPEPSQRESERSKRDTEHYLQYYQSSLADGLPDEGEQGSTKGPPRLTRQMSGGSTSPSDYSDSQSAELSTTVPLSVSKATPRPKAPSDGGSDRRRLAIMEVDPLDDSPPSKVQTQTTTIHARRGHPSSLAGLALVAPPDAAPNTYSHLTPLTTAPLTGDSTTHGKDRGIEQPAPEVKGTAHDAFRDTNHSTVNLGPVSSQGAPKATRSEGTQYGDQHSRRSRSPSPNPVLDASHQSDGLLSPIQHTRLNNLIVTPEIGEEKEIDVRVAAPVVISLESAGPFRRKPPSKRDNTTPTTQPVSAAPNLSSYLHYQPGVDATAGPLPPPPRAMFNIDTNLPAPPRPPRLNSPFSTRRGDIEAVKQALQLPPSVTAALSRTPKSNSADVDSLKVNLASKEDIVESEATSIHNSDLRHVKSVHRREGAFTPSSTSTSTTSDSESSQTLPNSEVIPPVPDTKVVDTKTVGDQFYRDDDVPPITVIRPMQAIEEQENEAVGNDATPDVISSSSAGQRTSEDMSSESASRPWSPPGETPSPPPKSFRNSLTNNLKRLSSSLPRTPSLKSRRSSGTYYSSRTPSPPMHMVSLPHTRPKIKSLYPPAMFSAEITARKTSMERCTLYAQKINELYMYDSGLGEWTFETKLRANNNRPTVAFSSPTFTPQPRHTSRASMISEATFPRRPDASTATDLSIRTHDLAPAAPPALPYPSLATYPTRTSSVTSGTPPSSVRSFGSSTPINKSNGFFASLGRKASMSSSRKDKPILTPNLSTASPARLTKNPPVSASPRVINIGNAPSVPGGPRAAPNHHRPKRSQTLMATTNSFSSNSPSLEHSAEALGRRPSQYDLNTEPILDIYADPEFVRQVNKLVDLLPNANRDVLAGYLRRAGQDILAIGQYLEDEKNGTIKAP